MVQVTNDRKKLENIIPKLLLCCINIYRTQQQIFNVKFPKKLLLVLAALKNKKSNKNDYNYTTKST